MTEPTSSTAAGIVGWKAIGGFVGVVGIGAFLAGVVVICMYPPRSKREWAVGIISTLVSSVAGGAGLADKLGYAELAAQGWQGLAVLFGLVFVAGLPGWFLVRAVFTAMERRKGKDIGELVDEARTYGRKPS